MYPTKYHRPKSVTEAAALFVSLRDAAYLAGGHTLLPAMKARRAAPANLIDLRHIPDLTGIDSSAGRVSIGAAVTHAEVAASPEIQSTIPALASLAGAIGDAQVRHLGTLGGSVAANLPAADYVAAILALAASIHTNARIIEVDDLFVGRLRTALQSGEIVTKVTIEAPSAAGYNKVRNPASHYALAATFVARHVDGSVRVAVIGAGKDGVFRWSEAESALVDRFDAAALNGLAVDQSQLIDNFHGSSAYRAQLVAVTAHRAVEDAARTLIER